MPCARAATRVSSPSGQTAATSAIVAPLGSRSKCTKRQEFVVGGYRPSDTGRGMASLILATYEDGKRIYRGRVGTGFTQAMRDTILAQLEQRLLDERAFASVPRDIARLAQWVKPELVAEVTYAEVTPDGSQRHPSFKGMRENKRADRVAMELPPAGTATLDPSVGKERTRASTESGCSLAKRRNRRGACRQQRRCRQRRHRADPVSLRHPRPARGG